MATDRSSGVSILTDWARSIGNTPWLNIVASYNDSSRQPASANVLYGSASYDNYSVGNVLTDELTWQVINSSITSGALPTDVNGIYFVISSKDVTYYK